LLLLASIFFVPLVAALVLYVWSGWRPAAGVQNGKLIEPPRPLPEIPLRRPDGSAAPVDALRGSWFLVYVADDACDTRCRHALTDMRQARLALDKDAGRVQRVLLHGGTCCDAGFGAAESDLRLLAAPGVAGASLRNFFPPAATGEPGIYVVDPHGNLVMSYPASGAASGIRKDLERLLRLSHIG
jgi:hypothetical protein